MPARSQERIVRGEESVGQQYSLFFEVTDLEVSCKTVSMCGAPPMGLEESITPPHSPNTPTSVPDWARDGCVKGRKPLQRDKSIDGQRGWEADKARERDKVDDHHDPKMIHLRSRRRDPKQSSARHFGCKRPVSQGKVTQMYQIRGVNSYTELSI